MPKIAMVQRPPLWLDRAGTIAQVVEQIDEAAAGGAQLIVFPEAYVPGYPDWIWRLRAYPDHKLTAALHERLMANAIDLETDALAPIRAAARKAGATVLLGVHEREGRFSRGTLYNTAVTIGADGAILNRHRKLVPTNPERMVWGPGDASGLRVVETPVGRVGALICWESYMPLARAALYADGVEVYVSMTWDTGEAWRASMMHIAKEGRCWVLASCMAAQARDLPEDFPGRAQLYPDPEEWVNSGDSMVVSPMGKVVAGPLHRDRGLLVADIDIAEVAAARRTFDAAGHSGRPDVFQLAVDRRPATPVRFRDDE